MNEDTLVSVGVPARNGEAFLEEALELLLTQTHANLEIIISDNNSTDATTKIALLARDRDARVRYVRHDRTLTASENFKFVAEQATGQYLMWAACDDRRSPVYVERLLDALVANPEASLAFGEVAEFGPNEDWQEARPFVYEFDKPLRTDLERIRFCATFNCLHIYGLVRLKCLQGYSWHEIESGPDIPLLTFLAMRGRFVRAKGALFYYYVPVRKTVADRAPVNSLHKPRPFPEIRLSLVVARSAQLAASLEGRRLPFGGWFFTYFIRHWRWLKPALYRIAPAAFRAAWTTRRTGRP